MMFNAVLLVNLCHLLLIISGIVQGSEDCYCTNFGVGSTVNCEISDQACLDQVVTPFIQDSLGTASYGLLRLSCNESEPIVFPRDLVKGATFSSLMVWCGSSVMEAGTLGTAEATITEYARIRLRQIPALQATRLLNLYIHGPNTLTITNDTFTGYHSLQNIEFLENTVIYSIEFGTFSTLPNLQSFVFSSYGIIHELGPGSLYFNPGTLKRIYLGEVDKIYPGAISGIPKEVNLEMIRLTSSDLSIEIFGGLLYGGSHLRVEAPIDKCKCSAAWIVRDNSSMSLNSAIAASVMCFDFTIPMWGPARLSSLSADDFTSCP